MNQIGKALDTGASLGLDMGANKVQSQINKIENPDLKNQLGDMMNAATPVLSESIHTGIDTLSGKGLAKPDGQTSYGGAVSPKDDGEFDTMTLKYKPKFFSRLGRGLAKTGVGLWNAVSGMGGKLAGTAANMIAPGSGAVVNALGDKLIGTKDTGLTGKINSAWQKQQSKWAQKDFERWGKKNSEDYQRIKNDPYVMQQMNESIQQGKFPTQIRFKKSISGH